MLEFYNDALFTADAAALLVGVDGRLNRNAQQYLTRVQGENVVATFYDLYRNNTVSNNWDRMSIGNRILDYVGNNPQANAFLAEVVNNPDMDSRMKSFAVMRLAGGFGGMESPSDPNVIRARMGVVQSLKETVQDERLTQILNTTERNLQNLLEGKPVENPWDRDRGRSDRERGRD